MPPSPTSCARRSRPACRPAASRWARNLRAFEAEFAAYCGAAAGVGISSGTAALTLALRALGVGPGDEVITVPNTYVATVFAITYVGATAGLRGRGPADRQHGPGARRGRRHRRRPGPSCPCTSTASASTWTPSARRRPASRSWRTPPTPTAPRYGERRAGSLGEMAAFSFYPSKVMGALGDGGIITTSDPELEARLRQLRYMGQARHQARAPHPRLPGAPRRAAGGLPARQAAPPRGRRSRAGAGSPRATRSCSRTRPLELPAHDVTGRHVYYMYTVLAPRREELRAHLEAPGIAHPDRSIPSSCPTRAPTRDQPVACGRRPRRGPLARAAAALPAHVRGAAPTPRSTASAAAIRDFYGVR